MAPPPPPAKGKAPPPPKRGGPPPPKAGGAARAPAYDGPKLRPLFWSSVSASQLKGETVWANLVPPAPFDQSQLERQFALTETRPIASVRKGSTVEEPGKRLRVLDDKTSELLAIAFHKLPPPEQLVAVVDSLNDFPEGLPAEAVLALHAAASEQQEAVEQLRQLAATGSDVSQLGLPERYLWLLGSIPAFAAKLACGALIVGPARELWELQQATAKVSHCCRDFRERPLVRKCISTSLAVGNLLNRGTARSNVQALVLPDSLLKLEELRGARPLIADGNPGTAEERGPTLLDFVAQALVDEPGAEDAKQLRAEALELRENAIAAKSVSLDEADATCKQVCTQAERAWTSIQELPRCDSVGRIAEKVRSVREVASSLQAGILEARTELQNSQQWLSAKAKITTDDWLAGWSMFFEQLSEAFARAQPPQAAKKSASELTCPFAPQQDPALQRMPLKESNVVPQGNAPPIKGAKMMDVDGQPPDAVQQNMAPARKASVTYNEEARAEDLMALLNQGNAGKRVCDKVRPVFDDKENTPGQH